jgi:hypothetical protein
LLLIPPRSRCSGMRCFWRRPLLGGRSLSPGQVIDRPHPGHPGSQLPVLGILRFQGINVPPEVCPAPLLPPRQMVVGGIEVGDQDAPEGIGQEVINDGPSATGIPMEEAAPLS